MDRKAGQGALATGLARETESHCDTEVTLWKWKDPLRERHWSPTQSLRKASGAEKRRSPAAWVELVPPTSGRSKRAAGDSGFASYHDGCPLLWGTSGSCWDCRRIVGHAVPDKSWGQLPPVTKQGTQQGEGWAVCVHVCTCQSVCHMCSCSVVSMVKGAMAVLVVLAQTFLGKGFIWHLSPI